MAGGTRTERLKYVSYVGQSAKEQQLERPHMCDQREGERSSTISKAFIKIICATSRRGTTGNDRVEEVVGVKTHPESTLATDREKRLI